MKKVFEMGVLFVLALAFAGPVSAANIADIINGLKAKENKVELKIKDITIVMADKLRTGQSEYVITSYFKGNKNRQDIKTFASGRETVQTTLFDGKDNWMINNEMKMRMPSAGMLGKTDKQRFLQSAALVNSESTILKTEKINGRDAYVVESKGESVIGGGKVRVWLDKENYDDHKTVYFDAAGKETASVVNSDFRKVIDSIQMPNTIKTYSGGKIVNHLYVRSVKVNQNLSDDIFAASKFKASEQKSVGPGMPEGIPDEPSMAELMKIMEENGIKTEDDIPKNRMK